MALVAGYADLPTVMAYSDLPAKGPFSGYKVIVASLGRVALWNGSAWSITIAVDS